MTISVAEPRRRRLVAAPLATVRLLRLVWQRRQGARTPGSCVAPLVPASAGTKERRMATRDDGHPRDRRIPQGRNQRTRAPRSRSPPRPPGVPPRRRTGSTHARWSRAPRVRAKAAHRMVGERPSAYERIDSRWTRLRCAPGTRAVIALSRAAITPHETGTGASWLTIGRIGLHPLPLAQSVLPAPDVPSGLPDPDATGHRVPACRAR